jgi:hypothetical protein
VSCAEMSCVENLCLWGTELDLMVY